MRSLESWIGTNNRARPPPNQSLVSPITQPANASGRTCPALPATRGSAIRRRRLILFVFLSGSSACFAEEVRLFMEEHKRMHESLRGNDMSEITSPSAQSHSIRLSLDLSRQRIFFRTSSLGRISATGSWRLGSIRPNLIIEGIPTNATTPAGADGDRTRAVDIDENDLRPGSLCRMSMGDSWQSSVSFSSEHGDKVTLPQELVDRVDSSLAQVGCRGTRMGDKENEDGLLTFADDSLILSFDSRSKVVSSLQSNVTPLSDEIVSPLPTDPMMSTKGNIQMLCTDKQYKLPFLLDYISYLSHLSVFGILGVYTRYLLQKLFGPDHLNLTGENNPLYLDLPSNMLGSFLMGWIGFVFKADIVLVSDHLQVGLSTGYLGSLTTFSGWNQKMLESSSKGHWADAIAGIILGIFLVNYSIIFGIGCAGRLRKSVIGWCNNSTMRRTSSLEKWRVDNFNKHVSILTAALLIWLSIWILSAEFFRLKLDDLSNSAVPWLAFLVGPPGVWTRWHLARLNGQGIGRKQMLKWLPIGTLLVNVLAACIMAALATISKAVNTNRCTIIISGIQLGFLGCLSTVSTFAAEVYAMWKTGHGLNAFLYIAATITISFALGTLIYSVPVWIKDYR